MNIVISSKSLMLNMTLDEVKKMSPEDVYIFTRQLKEIAKEMENKANGI